MAKDLKIFNIENMLKILSRASSAEWLGSNKKKEYKLNMHNKNINGIDILQNLFKKYSLIKKFLFLNLSR